MQGATRVALIHSYRTYKGTKYVPKTVHGALKWSDNDPFALEEPYKEAEWELVKHTKDKKPAKKQKTAGRRLHALSLSACSPTLRPRFSGRSCQDGPRDLQQRE